VDSARHLLAAHKVKSFAEISETQVAEGERVGSTMAGLVEEARWRTSAKGRRYMMATLSDPSGQFVATAFDDDVTTALEAAAKAGLCGLLSVELDRRAGDETPRVTIKRFQPLADLAKRTRLQMTVRVEDASSAERIARELAGSRGSNGLLRFIVPIASGGEALVVAGRDYALDAEIAARVERIAGEGSVDLSVQEPPKLALVG
jgi:DNA polymerase-3 subunit alpha